MSEFKGKAGTIYVEKVKASDREYEVWFEDFCILGQGDTKVEALKDARQNAADIKALIEQALAETITPAAAKDDDYEEQTVAVAGGG